MKPSQQKALVDRLVDSGMKKERVRVINAINEPFPTA